MMERPWFKYWPSRLPKTLDYPKVPLTDIIETSARRYPDKTAVIYYGKIYYGNKISYRDLLESTIRFSSFLVNELGVKKGG